MDFTKLISLFESQALFFTRADKFDDPYEGTLPKMNVKVISAPINLPNQSQELQEFVLEGIKKTYIGGNKSIRRCIGINCWYENEHESAAMWKLYLNSNEGIAIQSTFNLLKKSIVDERTVYLGKVRYIDYEKYFIKSIGSLIAPFLLKRKSFEHEREIRALILKWPDLEEAKKGGEHVFGGDKGTIVNGESVKVDIHTLIQKIYVAPNAPLWFYELLQTIIKKYEYNFDVIQSDLNNAPLY